MRGTRRSPMNKKYGVQLTDQERDELAAVIKKFEGASQKVRRAQILSKAAADGPNWTDRRICEAFGCRIRTVEKLRQRLVECVDWHMKIGDARCKLASVYPIIRL